MGGRFRLRENTPVIQLYIIIKEKNILYCVYRGSNCCPPTTLTTRPFNLNLTKFKIYFRFQFSRVNLFRVSV